MLQEPERTEGAQGRRDERRDAKGTNLAEKQQRRLFPLPTRFPLRPTRNHFPFTTNSITTMRYDFDDGFGFASGRGGRYSGLDQGSHFGRSNPVSDRAYLALDKVSSYSGGRRSTGGSRDWRDAFVDSRVARRRRPRSRSTFSRPTQRLVLLRRRSSTGTSFPPCKRTSTSGSRNRVARTFHLPQTLLLLSFLHRRA